MTNSEACRFRDRSNSVRLRGTMRWARAHAAQLAARPAFAHKTGRPPSPCRVGNPRSSLSACPPGLPWNVVVCVSFIQCRDVRAAALRSVGTLRSSSSRPTVGPRPLVIAVGLSPIDRESESNGRRPRSQLRLGYPVATARAESRSRRRARGTARGLRELRPDASDLRVPAVTRSGPPARSRKP